MTVIVLAAGMSRRMGGPNKLLLPLGGKTILEATLDHLAAAEPGRIVLVTGHEQARIRALFQHSAFYLAENPDYESGMTASIQAGIRTAAAETEGFMICLSDMPLITPEQYRLLMAAFKAHKQTNKYTIVQPVFRGARGNPVIFSAEYRDAILQLDYPEGCRPIVQANREQVVDVEMPNDAVLRDADTPEAYQQIIATFARQFIAPPDRNP
jgi:molybdenum cofactor cytidylyltransferase